MFWAIDKKNKYLYLCGTELYARDYILPKDGDCVIPNDKVAHYFGWLLINPFSGYKFVINKEKHGKLVSSFIPFPYGVTNFELKEEVEQELTSRTWFGASSSNDLVAFFGSFFEAIGYKVKICRLDYDTEKEMKEDGYEPAYYYGSGRGCALFVKKI
jgi:hypothetical protein